MAFSLFGRVYIAIENGGNLIEKLLVEIVMNRLLKTNFRFLLTRARQNCRLDAYICAFLCVSSCCVLVYMLKYVYQYGIEKKFSYDETEISIYIEYSYKEKLAIGESGFISCGYFTK